MNKPGSFTKSDPRINRKGRPRTFDALRELAQQVAHETAQANGSDVVINGHRVTVSEAILRQWAMSKNPQLQRAFIEIAYGKVPDNIQTIAARLGIDLTSDGGPITFKVVYENKRGIPDSSS